MYPRSAEVWSRKGFALNSLNKFYDAIVAFDKAIEIKPKSANAWNGKGIVLINMEKYDEAIQANNTAIAIKPKDAGPGIIRGWF
jgi:tetratricopeptide (TPR) repeat protein